MGHTSDCRNSLQLSGNWDRPNSTTIGTLQPKRRASKESDRKTDNRKTDILTVLRVAQNSWNSVALQELLLLRLKRLKNVCHKTKTCNINQAEPIELYPFHPYYSKKLYKHQELTIFIIFSRFPKKFLSENNRRCIKFNMKKIQTIGNG